MLNYQTGTVANHLQKVVSKTVKTFPGDLQVGEKNVKITFDYGMHSLSIVDHLIGHYENISVAYVLVLFLDFGCNFTKWGSVLNTV